MKSLKSLITLVLMAAVRLGHSFPADDQGFSNILNQLGETSPETDRRNATEQLQRLGTNAFPYLIVEMNSFKWHTPQETDGRVIDRAKRLRAAFDVYGTNLVCLTNYFLANLNTNRNFVSAMDGLVATGMDAVPYLVAALTNRESAIRLNAVGAILKSGRSKRTITEAATTNLILLLRDESEVTRSLAIETIGMYCAIPDVCIPALLNVCGTDANEVIRSQSIKAVGRIQKRAGQFDARTKMILEEVSKQDKSQIVRTSAERVLNQKEP